MTGTEPDHVLVVDDDDDIREMLQSSLSFAGFRVSTAPDAQSALTVLTQTEPDAMVLDVMMPGIDGFDLLQLCGTAATPCRSSSSPRVTPWRTGSGACDSAPTTTSPSRSASSR